MSTAAATSSDAAGMTEPDVRAVPAGRIGIWLFLITDAMGFGGLLIAYALLRVRADTWPDSHERLDIPQAALMTAALITSSLTMTLAVRAARAGRRGMRGAWLGVTLLLGLAFLGGQVLEYQHLGAGPRPMGLGTDVFAGTFYALTGYHGLHVLAGVLILAVMFIGGAARPRVLEVASLFWHFVDLAWIPIFSFVYLLPTT
jgi:cytochrome c oxidase subunit III